jgi:hypothetical protein
MTSVGFEALRNFCFLHVQRIWQELRQDPPSPVSVAASLMAAIINAMRASSPPLVPIYSGLVPHTFQKLLKVPISEGLHSCTAFRGMACCSASVHGACVDLRRVP